MKILKSHIQNILKIYRESSKKRPSVRKPVKLRNPALSGVSEANQDVLSGWTNKSEDGRREQIKKEIISEIIKKIR